MKRSYLSRETFVSSEVSSRYLSLLIVKDKASLTIRNVYGRMFPVQYVLLTEVKSCGAREVEREEKVNRVLIPHM